MVKTVAFSSTVFWNTGILTTCLQQEKDMFPFNSSIDKFSSLLLRTCLHGGGEPQTGEVTYDAGLHMAGHPTYHVNVLNIRDYMNMRVTPPKRVTSPTWGPLPLCKQVINYLFWSYAIICSLPCIKVFFSSIYQYVIVLLKNIYINICIKLSRGLFQL